MFIFEKNAKRQPRGLNYVPITNGSSTRPFAKRSLTVSKGSLLCFPRQRVYVNSVGQNGRYLQKALRHSSEGLARSYE